MSAERTPRDYADPYLAGAALGLVLLAAFVLVGRGLGASGAFASTAAGAVALVAPEQAAASPLFSHYLGEPGPWLEWLSVELLGVVIGAAASAALAGRLRVAIEARTLPHAYVGSGRITLSVGVAVADAHHDAAPAGLIARADAALYAAKRQGRNRVVVAES